MKELMFKARVQQGTVRFYSLNYVSENLKSFEGKDVYEVKYFTPASRALQAQQADSLTQLTQYKLSLQQGNPDVADLFNDDEALKIAKILNRHIKDLKFFNTICRPTRIKQKEIRIMP